MYLYLAMFIYINSASKALLANIISIMLPNFVLFLQHLRLLLLSIIKNHHNNAHTIFFFTLQRITILIQILSADFMFSFVSWLHVQLYLPLFCVWFQGYPLVVCLPGGYSRGGVCHSRSHNRSR